MSSTSDRLNQRAGEVLNEAQRGASAVAGAARDMGESAGEIATSLRGMLDRSLERQPLTTVLFVAVAGIILGSVLRR